MRVSAVRSVRRSALFAWSSFSSFLAYIPAVPITIELPDLEFQTEFNLARWAEILADPTLAKLPHRIETDQHGHILMSPPPAPIHGRRQAHISGLLRQFLPNGIAFSECPLSTAGGVKAVDVAWLSPERSEDISRLTLFERAPEICVEIVSPSNSRSEINEKRALYFDAGAAEVWICNPDGHISFFAAPHNQLPASSICPAFPGSIP
jgi:Uma2 family endonuclease